MNPLKILVFTIFVLFAILTLVDYHYWNAKQITPYSLGYFSNAAIVSCPCGAEIVSYYATDQQNSTCSQEATSLGPNQKVISYSLYFKNGLDSRYWNGVEANLMLLEKLYPGWVARIYTNDLNIIETEICQLRCKFKSLFWCDINHIPGLGDLSAMVGMTWRFLVLGDPLVDIFVVRDLDSRLSLRERMAVAEWENSNFSIHSMRDHPYHVETLMGGMWGGNNKLLGRDRSTKLQAQLIEAAINISGLGRGSDQNILNGIIYTQLSKDTMAHDSYFCGKFKNEFNRPFPIQRVNGSDFVGNIIDVPFYNYSASICPKKCRKRVTWNSC